MCEFHVNLNALRHECVLEFLQHACSKLHFKMRQQNYQNEACSNDVEANKLNYSPLCHVGGEKCI